MARRPVSLPGHFGASNRYVSRSRYEDKGCVLHSHCLDCPEDLCLLDVPGSAQKVEKQQRNTEVVDA